MTKARRALFGGGAAIVMLLLLGALAVLAGPLRLAGPEARALPRAPDESPTPRPSPTAPFLEIDAPEERVSPLLPFRLTGRVTSGATVTVDGTETKVKKNGRFGFLFTHPPRRAATVEATGPGGTTRERVRVRTARVPIRGVHTSAYGWTSDRLRKPIMRAIRDGRITTVQLDLKDESGLVGYRSKVPRARSIGAVLGVYDLEDTMKKLNRMGVRVVGRLVAFRDPVLARAAWRRGQKDQVIQAPNRTPYAKYGGFTNFASPAVQRYNIDIAVEAARAGVDDILYDYIRRPDGPLKSMRFPGIKGPPEKAIAGFVRRSRAALEPYNVELGISVFGVAATRPKEIAQDVPRLARHADYIAPMLYPSHWARGEYDVGHPNAQPYRIVRRSLKDFKRMTKGTGARVVPWLQDFSLGIHYGIKEVRAQIDATRDAGIDEWILWDPKVTYTYDALKKRRPRPERP